MKLVSKSLVLAAAMLLTSGAFASSKGTLQLSNPVTVNGTTLKAGDYKVQWEGSGPDVELSIMQGRNVVAKTSARLIDLETPAANDAAVTQASDSGAKLLAGIRFQGKKVALDLTGSGGAMQAGGSSK